jgi:hypothetical protein
MRIKHGLIARSYRLPAATLARLHLIADLCRDKNGDDPTRRMSATDAVKYTVDRVYEQEVLPIIRDIAVNSPAAGGDSGN